MKKLFPILLMLASATGGAYAKDWHVSPAGNDANNGASAATPFRTLQHAAGVVQPGDTVLVGDGVYTSDDRSDGGAVLVIKRSGTADKWITWKAAPGAKPEIRPVGWGGITVHASYQIIDGLRVIGANDGIVLLKAQEDTKNAKADPYFNTNGIYVNGRPMPPDQKPHHVVIRNCVVGKLPGAGLNAIEADYITMEDNQVFENAWFMRYGGSGISFLQNWAHDDKPGYHNIVRRNVVWNNRTMVAWEKIGRLSDGNGIIIDVTDLEEEHSPVNPDGAMVKAAEAKPKSLRPEWKGRTLVANNISIMNGGSGIHTFRAAHVDIVNNTTYGNGIIVGYPEIFANSSTDVSITNNIIVPRLNGKVTSNNKNTNVRWDYNLYPLANSELKGPHDIVADPKFVNFQLEPLKGDFHLQPGSAGQDRGVYAK